MEYKYIVYTKKVNGKTIIVAVDINTNNGTKRVNITNYDAADTNKQEDYCKQLVAVDNGNFFQDLLNKSNYKVVDYNESEEIEIEKYTTCNLDDCKKSSK